MNKEKLDKLKDYYKEGLTIIGLNDLEEIPCHERYFLNYLGKSLTNNENNLTIIDAFSSLINKTEHIDCFLKNNLSLEEIKLSKVYSNILLLENFMMKRHLPKSLGKIGYFSSLKNLVTEKDRTTFITSVLEESREPIIIYSSGYSNLKKEIDYDGKNIPKDYNYTLNKINSKKVLNKVIYGVERNFYNILSINDTSDIYVLNILVPNTLEEINNLVISFNTALYNLCCKYNLTYIDRNIINNNIKSLKDEILSAIYVNKFIDPKFQIKEYSDYTYNSKGILGVVDKILADWREVQKKAIEKEGHEKEHLLDIAKLHKDEYEALDRVQKVLIKRKKNISL